jgi:septal ring factor EnvC (AmiA/AmiB activator)
MGLRFLYITLILSLFAFDSLKADYNFEEDKKRQIFYLKNDIFEIQELVDRNNSILEEFRAELKSYNDTISILSDLIGLVQNNINQENDDLLLEEIRINSDNSKLNKLKESFKQKLIWMYKHGSSYDMEILFTAGSINEFYVRLEYLNKISQLRKNDFKRIQSNQFVIEEKKKILSLKSRQRLSYIEAKKVDQRTLYEKKVIVEDRIGRVTAENENYSRQLERKKKELTALQNRIAFMKDNFVYKIDQRVDYTGIPVSSLKGKLILPVNSVNIIEDFGTSVNPATLTITYNNGVDVSIARNSDVKCIADGIVEDVRYFPALGNILIVNHGEEYRTVYAVLSEVNVQKGAQVNAGDIIAKTGDNQNGQSFHFELWSGTKPIDPKEWFKRG